MLKKIIKKIHSQSGAISVTVALCLPVILGVIFIGIDVIRYNNVKTDLQRRVDSAAIAMVSRSGTLSIDEVVNENGEIINKNTGNARMDSDGNVRMACRISDKDVEDSIEFLKEDITNINDLTIENVSTEAQKNNGIARIEVSGKYDNFMVNYLPLVRLDISISAESYAACTLKKE